MSDRPTPESDAAKHFKYIELGHGAGYPEYEYVLFDFAQKLERERDTAKEEAARLDLCARANCEECAALKIELETVRAQSAASNEAVLNAAAADRIARETVIGAVRGALEHAATTFDRYTKIHADKGTDDGHKKAIGNYIEAYKCRKALAALKPYL